MQMQLQSINTNIKMLEDNLSRANTSKAQATNFAKDADAAVFKATNELQASNAQLASLQKNLDSIQRS